MVGGVATYRKRRPSGRNHGQRCACSFLAASRVVTGAGAPPAAETRNSPLVRVRRKHDGAVAVPGPAYSGARVAQGHRRPAGDVDLLQLALGKEADEPAVGRPERKAPTFRPWKHLRFYRVERPDRQRGSASGVDTKGDALAIRRKRLRDAVTRAADNRAARGRRDLKSDRGGRLRARASELQRADTEGRRGRHGGHHPRQARARANGRRTRRRAADLHAGFSNPLQLARTDRPRFATGRQDPWPGTWRRRGRAPAA